MAAGAASDTIAGDRAEARIGLFAAGLSIVLAGALIAARQNLPTDLGAVALAFCIGLWPVLGPGACRSRLVRTSVGAAGHGILTVALLLLPFGLVLLGLIGQLAIYLGAAVFVGIAARRARLGLTRRAAAGFALFLIAAMLLVLAIGGTKYVNFFADQLALFGRTDGDMFNQGAITNALRYFGVPSTGIDGIRVLHYHVGANVLTAALASARGLDAIFALILVKVLVMTPLLLRVAASVSRPLGRALGVPAASTLRTLGWTVGIVALLPLSEIGNIRLASESMLLGGILLLCAAPSLLLHWMRVEAANRTHWLFWLLMIPLITISKVSAGAIWFGLVGYTALRTFGLRNLQFWLVAAAALILFGAILQVANDPTGMSGLWFGQPYYVERGFLEGNYLLPLRMQIEWLGALICIWMLTRGGGRANVRRLVEPLLIAALGANLPGLLMQIPGGDAAYFVIVGDWIALPVLLAGCVVLSDAGAGASVRRRWASRLAPLLLAVIAIWLAVPDVKLGLRHFIAGNALLRTGDLSFYDNDNKRPVREDAERAWRTVDHRTLLSGPRAAAPADSLLARLTQLRRDHGNDVALYAGPAVADFWGYLRDCDLSASFPIAMTGVPMIDGYNPDQSVCPQEISRHGYGEIPQRRTPRTDADLCALAPQRAIKEVYVIESLTDRGRDRLLACQVQ